MSCEDIPSVLDLQKVKKHAEDFGRLMGTGTGTSTNEVTGQVRPTFNKVMNAMNDEFDAQLNGMGYSRVSTFKVGATLTNSRQTLLWDIADGGDGQEYGWSGSFSTAGKVVPPNSTPLTTGGITVGAWMSRFDPELRSEILKFYAANKIGILVGKMWAGESVTVACYGDSTTDGNGTTGWVANPVDGSGNAVGNSDHNITAPNAWPIKLQNILREINKGNTNIHVWNAGYSGKRMEDGWALRNYDKAVINNPFYGTPDITLIGFGLNDTGNVSSSIDNFVVNYRALITQIINDGTVPVLLTTDPGFRTGLYGESPIRDHKEARRELDSALKSLAAEFGVPIIDMGLALKGWLQNNTDGFRWSAEQPDAIHFSNNGHAFKAQFAATHLFNDIVLFDGGKKIINTWSSQATYNGTYAKIYGNANSLQGALPVFTSGAPKNTAMMTMWVWTTTPNSHLVYNGTENEGYNAGGYTVPPSISVKEFFAGSTLSKQVISDGDQLSVVKSSDSPYIHSKLKYGLNKVTYVSGDGDALFYGFFSIIESNKEASGNVLKDSGKIVRTYAQSTGVFIDPLQETSRLSNTAGVFTGEKISISFNATCPKGVGLILLHGQSYSGNASSVTNNEQNALVLYHEPAGTIGVYKPTYGNGGFIGFNSLVTSDVVWPSDTIEARVEIDKVGGVQRLTLFDAWAGGNVIYQFNLNQAGKRSRWGGIVGGFLCNTNHTGVPTAVAAINQMVINRG